jgi:CheY-like chemotaxis protein
MSDSGLDARRRAAEVLLVDDSFGCVLLAEEAFGAVRTPVRLSVAGNGEEALSMLRREGEHRDQPRPDLMLLDRNLPRMDGRTLLRAIKNDPDLRTIPVIVMTGSDAAADIDDSYALGANAYIVKPSSYEHLAEVVAAVASFWFQAAALPSRAAPGKAHAA